MRNRQGDPREGTGVAGNTSTESLVRIENVSKHFGTATVLSQASLTIERGQTAFIIGSSGAGKSTLLRCINALETYDTGAIWVGDTLVGAEMHKGRYVKASSRELARLRSRIGMVFQHFNLFPNKSVIDNVTFGLHLNDRTLDRSALRARGLELLGRVGLADRADAYPNQLSGGQKQRVAIARAIANDPEVVLFDEPTSALDPELVGEVLEVIRELADHGMTLITVTHEMSFAREIADVVFFLDEGRVLESGPPQQLLVNPREERTRAFLRRSIGNG